MNLSEAHDEAEIVRAINELDLGGDEQCVYQLVPGPKRVNQRQRPC